MNSILRKSCYTDHWSHSSIGSQFIHFIQAHSQWPKWKPSIYLLLCKPYSSWLYMSLTSHFNIQNMCIGMLQDTTLIEHDIGYNTACNIQCNTIYTDPRSCIYATNVSSYHVRRKETPFVWFVILTALYVSNKPLLRTEMSYGCFISVISSNSLQSIFFTVFMTVQRKM